MFINVKYENIWRQVAMNYKTPVEIAKNACHVANAKGNMSFKTLLVMGFLAGAYVAFGGFLMTSVTQDAALYMGVGMSKLMGGIVFTVGLMLVVVGGAELFTGNCLMPIGVLSGCVPVSKVVRNWAIVYSANFLGSIAMAWLAYHSGIVSGAVGVNALKIAAAKVNIEFGPALIRGILCNWLVVMAVWMSYSALDIVSKYICCLVPVSAFVAMGFEHSVANMYFLPLGMMIKNGSPDVVEAAALAPEKLAHLNLAGFFGNIVPVTMGNIVGGVLFVATLYYLVFSGALGHEEKQ